MAAFDASVLLISVLAFAPGTGNASIPPDTPAKYKMLDSESERCSDGGLDVIKSLRECAQAAATLKLAHRVPVITPMWLWRSTPRGCYVQARGLPVIGRGLRFNPDPRSTADGTAHGDVAICRMLPAPEYPVQPAVHRITSFDGTVLTADSERPLTANKTARFPLVVLINSWGVPEIEYLAKTIEWAKFGFVMVEYQARGWYGSGGKIDVAGSNDLRDCSAVIDWALEHFPSADPDAVAVGGISYGSGISLLASAVDRRVKVVLMLSGWSDLLNDLNWGNSPAITWGLGLIDSARWPVIGRETPELHEVMDALLAHKNMSFVEGWASARSPRTLLDRINANRPAVYMSHQHQDNLFHSDIELDMWGRLECPKHLDLNQGTHASAEILGLVGVDLARTASDHIWGQARAWVDHYLKGIDSGAAALPQVQMQLGNDGPRSDYVSFDSWPPAEGWGVYEYFVGPRVGTFGTLSRGPPANGSTLNYISFSEHSGMSTGMPFFADLLKVVTPITADLATLDPAHAIIFVTGVLDETGAAIVCGVPRLTALRVVPTEPRFQLVAYIFELDLGTGKGRLITHGVSSVWGNATVGEPFALPDLTFHSSCFEIRPGHALALGFNMYDTLYKPASTTGAIAFAYDPPPILELPLLGRTLPDPGDEDGATAVLARGSPVSREPAPSHTSPGNTILV